MTTTGHFFPSITRTEFGNITDSPRFFSLYKPLDITLVRLLLDKDAETDNIKAPQKCHPHLIFSSALSLSFVAHRRLRTLHRTEHGKTYSPYIDSRAPTSTLKFWDSETFSRHAIPQRPTFASVACCASTRPGCSGKKIGERLCAIPQVAYVAMAESHRRDVLGGNGTVLRGTSAQVCHAKMRDAITSVFHVPGPSQLLHSHTTTVPSVKAAKEVLNFPVISTLVPCVMVLVVVKGRRAIHYGWTASSLTALFGSSRSRAQ